MFTGGFGSFILRENNKCHVEVYAIAADVDYVPQIKYRGNETRP